MLESFLILLAGGVMYAAALADPKQVTLHWLRLAGIIALVMSGMGMFFLMRSRSAGTLFSWAVIFAVLLQLAFAQIGWRTTQRMFCFGAFIAAVLTGVERKPESVLSFFGVASMCGIGLMDMLLGHAYLTASKMTIAPFRQLNLALAIHLILRALVCIGGAMLMQRLHPIYMLWGKYGLFILTRWLVGLAVPAVFVYMAHDCIRRRSTQSATGILYVAGVLIFIGEIVGLYLVGETGFCF